MGDTETANDVRYRVGEVCRLADVQPYVLRYWESEFPVLGVDRGAAGPRLYSARELKIIERIKKLLYDEGYTIAGAKKRLDSEIATGVLDSMESSALAAAAVTPRAPDSSDMIPILEVKPKRAKKSSGVTAAPQPELVEVIEEPVAPAPAAPPPDVSTGAFDPPAAAMVQTADPRVATALAELKEILEILRRDA